MNPASPVRLSRHAAMRAGQRGIRDVDLRLVAALGTGIGGDRYVLDPDEASDWTAGLRAERDALLSGRRTRRDVRRARRLRRMLGALERGCRVVLVICEDTVVTAYARGSAPARTARLH